MFVVETSRLFSLCLFLASAADMSGIKEAKAQCVKFWESIMKPIFTEVVILDLTKVDDRLYQDEVITARDLRVLRKKMKDEPMHDDVTRWFLPNVLYRKPVVYFSAFLAALEECEDRGVKYIGSLVRKQHEELWGKVAKR